MTTLTEDQIAAQLYPTMVKAEAPAAPPPAQSDDPVQAHALKELHATNNLYGENAFRDVNLLDPAQNLNRPAEEVAEENSAHRDDLWALQASDPQAVEVTNLLRAAAVNPITQEVQAQQLRDAQTQLVSRYGEAGARERMALVQQLLARAPRLAKRIADAGLANHPNIVQAAHEIAWSQRAKGLL